MTIRQPDGQLISILQQGDEWHHWVTDLEGRLLVQDDRGFYQIATDAQYKEWQAFYDSGEKKKLTYLEKRNNKRFQGVTRATANVTDTIATNHLSDFPTTGEIRSLVILVDFPDRSFQNESEDLNYYNDFMMKKGFNDLNSYGSVHDYFVENSMGMFNPQFDVYGPIRMSHEVAYYGKNNVLKNDIYPHEMVIEACSQLEDEIDFSQYDNDGDGYVDVVQIIYAGPGENSTGEANDIWPHSYSVIAAQGEDIKYDGKIIDNYVCINELFCGIKDGIGTFCHEFIHVLGLPDVYDSKKNETINGDYDVMDSGLYLGGSENGPGREGRCPCALTAYERYELGWLTPDTLIANKYNGITHYRKDTISLGEHLTHIITVPYIVPYFAPDTLPCLPTTNKAFILPVKSETCDIRNGEYFILENRQKTRWDTNIPGHGLLIWHIDYIESLWKTNTVNTNLEHPCILLVKADNHLATASGDPFPGSRGITQYTATTSPAFLGWSQRGAGKEMKDSINNASLTDIKEQWENNWSTEEMVIIFSFTNDGPDHVTAIEKISEDIEAKKFSSHPRRIWRNGQLLIETSTRLYDPQGRLIDYTK